jgi:hypothetical protein
VRQFLDKWAPWIAVGVLIAGVAAYAATRISSGGGSSSSNAAAETQTGPTVPLDPKARAVAQQFVATAVARKHLAEAWNIAGPELKSHLTLAKWLTGTIPVTPYPVGKALAKYTVESSYPGDAELRVTFVPPLTSSTPSGDFLITLHKDGGSWLVTSWVPRQIVNAPGG